MVDSWGLCVKRARRRISKRGVKEGKEIRKGRTFTKGNSPKEKVEHKTNQFRMALEREALCRMHRLPRVRTISEKRGQNEGRGVEKNSCGDNSLPNQEKEGKLPGNLAAKLLTPLFFVLAIEKRGKEGHAFGEERTSSDGNGESLKVHGGAKKTLGNNVHKNKMKRQETGLSGIDLKRICNKL